MAHALSPVRPSRRQLLASAGASALAGIAAVTIAMPELLAADPDAEMMAVAAEVDRIHAEAEAYVRAASIDLKGGTPECEAVEEEFARRLQVANHLIDDLIDMHPQTMAGHRARAKAFITFDGGNKMNKSQYRDDCLLAAIIRDLAENAA